MKYEQALQALYQRNEFRIKLGLENIQALVKDLKNPLKNYPTIHIAGTNGKGSVANFIAAILKEQGYKVGLYTSPHLIDFRERIQINHKKISKKNVLKGLGEIETIIQRRQMKYKSFEPTYFEVVTALAFKYFKDQRVDIAILETGLGGRLDSTNICDPLVSVITNIGRDHTHILGSKLSEIAYEKAGIIKKDRPLVLGEKRTKQLEVLKKEAKKKKTAPVLTPSFVKKKNKSLSKESFDYLGKQWTLNDLTLNMGGEHQVENALTAITALEQIQKSRFKVSPESIRKGLKKTVWPGRFHLLQENPQLFVDGAHNLEALTMLSKTLKQKQIDPILLFGLMNDKEALPMVKKAASLTNSIYLVQSNVRKALSVHKLKQLFEKIGYSGKLKIGYTIEKGLPSALKQAQKQNRAVCVCGSLYLVGETIQWVGQKNAE